MVKYLVEYDGNLSFGPQGPIASFVRNGPKNSWNAPSRLYDSLSDALNAISIDFPMAYNEDFLEAHRRTPDPEDDRIVVWEFTNNESRKAVWAFCGWHWDLDELGLTEQGKLPGDTNSLYDIAME